MQAPDSKGESVPTAKRRRGGQAGNRNRMTHGLYSEVSLLRKARLRAIRRKTRHLILRIRMVGRGRRALYRLQGNPTLAAHPQASRFAKIPAAREFLTRPAEMSPLVWPRFMRPP